MGGCFHECHEEYEFGKPHSQPGAAFLSMPLNGFTA